MTYVRLLLATSVTLITIILFPGSIRVRRPKSLALLIDAVQLIAPFELKFWTPCSYTQTAFELWSRPKLYTFSSCIKCVIQTTVIQKDVLFYSATCAHFITQEIHLLAAFTTHTCSRLRVLRTSNLYPDTSGCSMSPWRQFCRRYRIHVDGDRWYK